MSKTEADAGRIVLGDPVPWFSAPLIADGAFNLSVAAGRWIVLSFWDRRRIRGSNRN